MEIMTEKPHCRSLAQAVVLGLALGFTAALAYGFLFAIYGIVRSSLPILRAPENGLVGTLIANAAAVFIGSAFFAIFFGIIAALVEAIAMALVYARARTANRDGSRWRGAWIGFVAAVGVVLAVHLIFFAAGGMLVQLFGRSSYLFWLGLPSVICVALTAWAGSRVRFGPGRAGGD
jgi:hypothetical protein